MNLSTPDISIISSLWLEEDKLLRRCIESIIGQTFKNFEWIIVDDGASLSNLELIKSFNDPRIKIIKNRKNLGLTVSLNIAAQVSGGKYIARMDTDDYCLSERLEKQLKFMQEKKDYVLCGCFYHEEILGVRKKPFVKLISSFYDIKKDIATFNPVAHPSWFFRKDIFVKLGGYDESFRYAQDYELLGRFLKCGKICNLEEVLLVRNISSDRISSRQNREQLLFSLRVRMKLFIQSTSKFSSFVSIFKSAVKYLFHPLFYKELSS